MRYLELDLGGVTPDDAVIEPTFEVLEALGLGEVDLARASFTIDVLGLNREVIRVARGNAFGGFRARLREYVEKREEGVPDSELRRHRNDLLRTPHLTVFVEMRRQRRMLPEIDDFLSRAPEAFTWPVIAATAS